MNLIKPNENEANAVREWDLYGVAKGAGGLETVIED